MCLWEEYFFSRNNNKKKEREMLLKSVFVFVTVFAFAFSSEVIEIGDSDFNTKVAETETTLVMFYAPWYVIFGLHIQLISIDYHLICWINFCLIVVM